MRLSFTKMHGLGNDFMVTHDVAPEDTALVQRETARLCERRTGVGADGVVLLLPPLTHEADFRMRIFNSDGSEAEMCGNAIRCCALYARMHGLSGKTVLHFDTGAGRITTDTASDGRVRVTMSRPVLDAAAIPTQQATGQVIMHDLTVEGRVFTITAVSMGNPHAVIYARDLSDDLVHCWGPKIERHPFFPRKTNVEFVHIVSPGEIRMRVWERGCGETRACGTGACASVVAGIINRLHGNAVTVHLLGGDLFIEWDGDLAHPVYMTGPAAVSFTGNVELAP